MHQDGSDSEEEEEGSNSDEVGQEETTKKNASKKNKKTDLKPYVYPYDLGWKSSLSQVSKGQIEALCIAVWRLGQWVGSTLLSGMHFTPVFLSVMGCS